MQKRIVHARGITAKGPREMKKIAAALAEEISRKSLGLSHALVIGLTGDLGSGKTTFTQGFARGLGIKEKVLSPTFVLMRHYPLKIKNFATLTHVDCYRLDNPQELASLGWHDLIADPAHLMLVEWADRIKNILPPHFITLSFHHVNEFARAITITETINA